MNNKNLKKSGSYIFAGVLFISMGLGWVFGNIVVGTLLGIGIGSLILGILSFFSK